MFKKLAVTANNNKNLCYTLAKRHEMRLCWEMSADDILQAKEDGCSSQTYAFSVLCSDLKDIVLHVLNVTVADSESIASVRSHFLMASKSHVTKCMLLMLLRRNKYQFFCVVKYIICVGESWLLCARLLIPNCFVEKYHAFCVQKSDGWFVIRPHQLTDNHPVDFFDIDGQSYVSLRHTVVKH